MCPAPSPSLTGDLGLPLLRAAGQALPPGCRHVRSHETWASAKPLHTSASALCCLPLPLCTEECCCPVLPAVLKTTFKDLGHPNSSSISPHQSSWKCSKHRSRLFYCFLHPALWKGITGITSAKLQHPLSV